MEGPGGEVGAGEAEVMGRGGAQVKEGKYGLCTVSLYSPSRK